MSKETGDDVLSRIKPEDIYSGYDLLCRDYPEWICREDDIGLDCDGNPIRHYTLRYKYAVVNSNEHGTSPNQWSFDNDYQHVLINAGFHGNEKSSVFGVFLLVKEIIESNDDWARYIRTNVILDVIPITCPWNFCNSSRKNSNCELPEKVNLNPIYIA